MKIRLRNFRCYTDTTFDLGDTGMTLLSAQRGEGKSSILMGIHFALFGTGTKVVSHDASTCTVEVWFNDMYIKRTRRPNRLVLNNEYEDDTAQKLINDVFGEMFESSGYIAQNALNSFVAMSPIDKLEFLEKFAFRDTDIAKLKLIAKERVKTCEKALISATASRESSTEWASRYPRPTEKKEFPLKCKRSHREIAIKNTRTKLHNCKVKIKKEIQKSDTLTSKLHAFELRNANIASKTELLAQATNTFNEIGESDFDKSVYAKLSLLERKLNIVRELSNINALKHSIEDLEQELQEMRESETSRISSQIDEIRHTLWTDMTEEECTDGIEQIKEQLNDASRVRGLYKELESLKVDVLDIENAQTALDLLLEKQQNSKLDISESMTCPSCQVSLRLSNKSLVLEDSLETISVEDAHRLATQITEAKSHLQKLQADKNKMNTLLEHIKTIQDKYEEQLDVDCSKELLTEYQEYLLSNRYSENCVKSLETELVNLNTKCPSIVSITRKLNTLKHDLNKTPVPTSEPPTETEEELIESITLLKKENEDQESKYRTRDRARRDMERLQTEIERINKEYTDKYPDDIPASSSVIETEIEDSKSRLVLLEKEQDEYDLLLCKITEWEEFQKELNAYTNAKQEVAKKTEEETECRAEYESSLKFKTMIVEAESIALSNIIESINIHAQVFLDEFFQDNPMVARLDAFRETKQNVKPQVNIKIHYKGGEPDIKSLSGGEFACVVLAYALALAEMFNTPLIMLDECTASLDQETTNIVFEGIREHLPNKLIVCAAHQLATGGFDRILQPAFNGEWTVSGSTISGN